MVNCKLLLIGIVLIVLISGCAQQAQRPAESSSPPAQSQETKYSSSSGQIEFAKMPSWTLDECKTCGKDEPLVSLNKNGANVNFFVQESQTGIETTLSEFKGNLKELGGVDFKIISEEEIQIDKNAAKHLVIQSIVENEERVQELALSVKGTKLYVISATYKSNDLQTKAEFKKLLESVKLV